MTKMPSSSVRPFQRTQTRDDIFRSQITGVFQLSRSTNCDEYMVCSSTHNTYPNRTKIGPRDRAGVRKKEREREGMLYDVAYDYLVRLSVGACEQFTQQCIPRQTMNNEVIKRYGRQPHSPGDGDARRTSPSSAQACTIVSSKRDFTYSLHTFAIMFLMVLTAVCRLYIFHFTIWIFFFFFSLLPVEGFCSFREITLECAPIHGGGKLANTLSHQPISSTVK